VKIYQKQHTSLTSAKIEKSEKIGEEIELISRDLNQIKGMLTQLSSIIEQQNDTIAHLDTQLHAMRNSTQHTEQLLVEADQLQQSNRRWQLMSGLGLGGVTAGALVNVVSYVSPIGIVASAGTVVGGACIGAVYKWWK
jgi:hypothetical protein